MFKNILLRISSVVLTILFAFAVGYYYTIPLSIYSDELWYWTFLFFGFYFICDFVLLKRGRSFIGKNADHELLALLKTFKISLIVILVLGILFGGSKLIAYPIFRAKDYASLLGEVKEGNFEKDLELSDASNLLTVDRKMAEKLGSRKVGEVNELVSQFEVSDDFVQVAKNNLPIRVSPLEYASFIRWLDNKDGIPYYVEVDAITGVSKLVKTEQPMKYSKSEYFNRNVRRHLWLKHPTALIEEINFEVDEQGHPYYVATEVKANIGFFNGKDVIGVYIVDAITGEISHYEVGNVPDWVDRVYSAKLLEKQLNDYGQYQDGFLNSIGSKRGVVQVSEGYQYFVKDNDLFLYTGLTSVLSDESNIGFVLVNSRTKEVFRYDIGVATEFSAQESAEGSVQEKGYNATFPLLVNVESNPTYFLSLKDEAGLIKLYAFIDAQNYQKVSIGETVQIAYQKYTGNLGRTTSAIPDSTEKPQPDIQEELKEFSGTIEQLSMVVLNGETHAAFKLKDQDTVYFAPVSLDPNLVFISVGKDVSGRANAHLVKQIVIK